MLRSGLSNNEESRCRFIKEAQITGRLEHPGIVPVHFLGADKSGNDFFSMKLVSGRTLDEILSGWHKGDKKIRSEFSLARLVSIFERVCETLAFAHSHHVIHRDLKPSNIMIGVYGEVWIIDWGLATAFTPQPGRTFDQPRAPIGRDIAAKLTMDGLIGGTPSYMAPEQAQGLELDDGADIFSLGGVLYEILTSKPPHDGKSASDVLIKAAEGRVTPVHETRIGRHAPKALAAIAQACLAADRQSRYESVSAIIRDLRAYADDQPVAALPETMLDRLKRFGRRNRRALAIGASLAIMMLIVISAAAVSVANKDRQRLEADRTAQEAVIEKQKAEAEKQRALIERDEKARRRFKAFGPYAEAMDLLLRGQLPEKAAEQLKQALTIDADFLEAQFALGQALSAAGRSRDAGDAYVKAEQMSVTLNGSHHLRALVSAGIAYDDASDYEAGQKCFLEAEKWGADDPLALVGRTQRLLYNLNRKDVLQIAEDAVRRGGHLWETHYALGMVHYMLASEGFVDPVTGSSASAAEFRRALALAPRQAEPHEWLAAALSLNPSTPEVIAEIRTHVDHAIELQPHDGDRRSSRAYFAGLWGQSDEADFAEAVRLGASLLSIKIHQARRELRSGNVAAVFDLYSDILTLTHTAPLYVAQWARAGIALGKFEKVLPIFKQWANDHSGHPYVLWARALLCERRDGNRSDAITLMRDALKIAPFNFELHTELARLLCDDQQFNESLAATDEALKVSSGSSLLFQVRLHVLKQLKRFAEAREYLQQLNEKFPGQINDFEKSMAQISAMERAAKTQEQNATRKTEPKPPEKAPGEQTSEPRPSGDNPFDKKVSDSKEGSDNPFDR
jgi:tetratricopeptide (TPR) repeat protein